jgi:hypothetical protein
MDNLGAIPGLLAALAIVDAIRHIQRPTVGGRAPIRLCVRPVLDAGRRCCQRGRPRRAGRLLRAAGVAIGCVETAEHAALATAAPARLRGWAFGLLAAIQSFGNLAASAIAGLLWTAASPPIAFAYLAGWMARSLIALATARVPAPTRP